MSFTPEKIGFFLGAAICVFAAFFVLKKLKGHKVKNVHIVDPEAQAEYEKKSAEKEEDLGLTMQERIEISWEFLTRITQQVIERFSKTDQEEVLSSGKKLVKNGMQYHHNIYQETTLIKKSSKSRSIKQNKEKEISI